MDIKLTTYKDLLDHTVDFLGANPGGDASRDARRAIQAAYRDLANRRHWVYYYTRGRLNTVAPYSTGTVAYTDATRTVTLSGGTWPSWAGDGVIVLNNLACQIALRSSGSDIILSRASALGADVAAGATYTLYQDTYNLPVDCIAIDRLILVNNAFVMSYEHPADWLERQRIIHSPATPRYYTIRGSPNYAGSLALSLFPAPDDTRQFDFIYQRRPRPLLKDEISVGTATATNGSDTITGVGTSWGAGLIGSSIRLSADSLVLPSGLAGANPAELERVIVDVVSATSLTMDQVSGEDLTGVKYLISDPADIEESAMLTALQRGCELQVSISRNMKTKDKAEQAYNRALIEAMEADSRSFAPEAEGRTRTWPTRLAHMPRGADIS